MAVLQWDLPGERLYETGVEKTVLFPVSTGSTYDEGVAWNGVSQITESPSGGEPTDIYADDQKYLTMYSLETLGGTIEAYMYPPEFEQCDGSADLTTGISVRQQTRKSFGLVYQTLIGNDTVGTDYGKKMHFVYGCKVSPSERTRQTVNESPEATTNSWTFTTTPVSVTGHKATAKVEVDSTKVSSAAWTALENAVIGTADTAPRFLTPDEIKAIVEEADAESNTTPGGGDNTNEPQG